MWYGVFMSREVYPGAPRIHPERIASLKACPPGLTKDAGPFADLTWAQQRAAEQWFFKFCARWGNDLPPWRRGILVGVARRLAKNPPDRQFGLSLHRHLGAKGLVRRVRRDGIVHPGIAAMRAARSLPALAPKSR